MANIQITPDGSDAATVTVRLHGEVDVTGGNELRLALIDVIMRRRPSRLLIDVCAVTAIDPYVLGILRAARDIARDLSLPLAFAGEGSPVAAQLHRDLMVGTGTCPS